MHSLLLLKQSVGGYWICHSNESVSVLGSLALQATVDYINKCKILCINCGYAVIVWQGAELVKWNGSDVVGAMKYCPCSWTTPARRSVLAPKVVTAKSN